MDLAAAAEEVSADLTEVTQQGDVGDTELARPAEEPSASTTLQPGDAMTELGITDQPALSDAASLEGEEVEPISIEPDAAQPSDHAPIHLQAS